MKEKQKFIIGKKVGMTQVFDDAGNRIAVTVVEAGPCAVIQKKNVENDGYSALQIGFNEVKESKLSKPVIGHLRKFGIEKNLKIVKEFRVSSEVLGNYSEGDEINVGSFEADDKVVVSATSVGKGFAGTVKRWNFRIGPMAHGSKNHRKPGSIGGGTGQARVFKGKKMAGHYGSEKVTTKNIRVVRVVGEDNLILLAGAVPGKKNSVVTITL